ncbi:uncharacterized protein [Triticum aestivum]|uniref:uncharacterized protein isoform X1 n=1 Tax=Triticum aestivum TaxID=4565 RepID=UPI001D033829|nr:uncharacterized protein LOC123123815 isoform X1 [Triticum aestivum]
MSQRTQINHFFLGQSQSHRLTTCLPETTHGSGPKLHAACPSQTLSALAPLPSSSSPPPPRSGVPGPGGPQLAAGRPVGLSSLSRLGPAPLGSSSPTPSCRSEDNGPEEREVGVLWSDLRELGVGLAGAALEPGVRAAEHSGLRQARTQACIVVHVSWRRGS